MTTADTDTLAERIGRILNEEGWTFEGIHEPGEYDECEDCRSAVAPIAARIATVAHAHLAAQEPTDAEVEAGEESIDCLFGWEHLRRYGGQSEEWMDRLRKSITHNVLSAARAARRDEEKRDE